jgi:hypothetical protein
MLCKTVFCFDFVNYVFLKKKQALSNGGHSMYLLIYFIIDLFTKVAINSLYSIASFGRKINE